MLFAAFEQEKQPVACLGGWTWSDVHPLPADH